MIEYELHRENDVGIAGGKLSELEQSKVRLRRSQGKKKKTKTNYDDDDNAADRP